MSSRRPDPDAGVLLFRQFLRDRRIASVKSTSPYLVHRICSRMDFTRRRVVVEYGPGLGCFTRVLLERLTPDSRLILLETNPEFVSVLRRFRDPRLRLAFGSAEGVRSVLQRLDLEEADYVLSGIPFSLLPEAPKMRLLEDTRAVLGDHGVFLAYQSSAHLKKYLARVFHRVRIRHELFHIPPLVVLEARGKAA